MGTHVRIKDFKIQKKLKKKKRKEKKDHSHGKEMQKSKMAVCRGLTNSCEKKRSKKQRRKGNTQASECKMRIARRDKKAVVHIHNGVLLSR